MSDVPNFDDEFMRAGLDPAFRFAPPPALAGEELLDAQLAAAERSVALVSPRCPLCNVPPRAISWDRFGYPQAVEEFHLAGCPADGL